MEGKPEDASDAPASRVECLDEQAALDLVAGWLLAGEATILRAHVASCAICFELVATAMADHPPSRASELSATGADAASSSPAPWSVSLVLDARRALEGRIRRTPSEVSSPMPMHLDLSAGGGGEVHIKSSYCKGGRHVALKVAKTSSGGHTARSC